MFRRRKTPGFTGFCGKAPPGGPSGGPQCVALQVQRLGAVRLRDAGVADQHVSQTVVCDTRARTPSGARRRVSYPVSDSMSCRRRAKSRARKPVLTRRQRSALFCLSDDDLQHIGLRRPSPQQAWLRAGKVEVMSGEMTTLRIVSTAEELIGYCQVNRFGV